MILVFVQTISCKTAATHTFPNPENTQYRVPDSINSKMNHRFGKSRKSFFGKIEKSELKELLETIELHLKTVIHSDKPILINYKQRGDNCFDYNYEDLLAITRNVKRISKRMSDSYYIQEFFMYSKKAYNRDVYENLGYYIEDSGFFKENIFTLEETCAAFFLLKPNGDFLKFYGGDYFSEVRNFMESELIMQEN